MKNFSCILADPPWEHGGPGWLGGADNHYQPMESEDIFNLPVDMISADDAHLWLWATEEVIRNGDAVECCKRWGFEDKALWPWTKLTKHSLDKYQKRMYKGRGWPMVVYPKTGELHGLVWANGYYSRVTNEYLILAVRGDNIVSDVERQTHRQIIAPTTGKHSGKPDESYELIEPYTPGPGVELFARRKFSDYWSVWGREVDGSIDFPEWNAWEKEMRRKRGPDL